jgi:inositol phosphorylceramide mannosyltransferase catalytic subunit
MHIPKIIHQTWKTNSIPSKCKAWSSSWKKFHPDYEYKLWTDKDNRELIKKHYPKFLTIYDNYSKGVYRADIARYIIIYHYGGLYVDLDFECLKNMDKLLEDNKCFFAYEPSEHFINGKPKICNALFASTKYNPIFIKFLREAFQRSVIDINRSPVYLTGPEMITNVLNSIQNNNIKIYNSAYFYPKCAKNDSKISNLNPDKEKFLKKFAYAQHHWMKSWITGNSC